MDILRKITPAILISLFITPILAQTVAVQVDYMYVKPENENMYLEIEQQWKPLHEQRIKEGIITGWRLYEVMFTGENDPFNYVTVTYFNDFAAMESSFPEHIFEKVYPEKDMDAFMDKTLKSRSLVYSRAFHNVVGIPHKSTPSNFISLSAFSVKSGLETEYEAMEKEIWQPIHKYAYENGSLNSWGIWYLYPNPGENFNYVAANGYMTLGGQTDYNAIFGKVFPDKDMDEIIEKTLVTRQITETWVWHLIDYCQLE